MCMWGSEIGYLVIHTWETKGLPYWAIDIKVTEADKTEWGESKLMWVSDYLYIIFCIICILFTTQYENIQSEGQGHTIEQTNLNTDTWTVALLCAKHSFILLTLTLLLYIYFCILEHIKH